VFLLRHSFHCWRHFAGNLEVIVAEDTVTQWYLSGMAGVGTRLLRGSDALPEGWRPGRGVLESTARHELSRRHECDGQAENPYRHVACNRARCLRA